MPDPSSLEQAQPKRPRVRVQAGLAFVQRLRPALYALLVASALISFWAGGSNARHVAPWVGAIAPILFGAFLLIFAVYRLALIRARRYPVSTGLFQLGLGVLVFVLLLPGPRRAISARARANESGDDVLALLDAGDPRVRALAAEVAALRGPGPRYVPALVERLDDPDAHVRAVARASLSHEMGIDLPTEPSEDAAAARLKTELTSRGWLVP